MNHQTWVLVANSSDAKIFRLVKFPEIKELTSLSHPESRLRDSELVTDRQGRNFEKGGVTRHAYQSRHDPKSQEMEKFAREIARFLCEAHVQGLFSRLYLFASPAFLGILRPHLTEKLNGAIIAEEAKDLCLLDKSSIEEHISDLRAIAR